MQNETTHETICNAEAALLGLLAEFPKHPYQIGKDVEMRDMQSWTELSMTTVYKMLRRLELKHLVQVETWQSMGERTKHVYSLLPAGRKALKAFLRHELSHQRTTKSSFDVAIYWSDALPDKEVAKLLESYRKELQKAIEFWQCMVGYLADCGCPKSDQALCDRKAHMLQGELTWLDNYRQELQNG
jgi:DNA-binding PadR family transcriptional regulator